MKTGHLISVTISLYFDPILKIISVRITFIVQVVNIQDVRKSIILTSSDLLSIFGRRAGICFSIPVMRGNDNGLSRCDNRVNMQFFLCYGNPPCYCTRTVAMYSVPSGTAMPGSAISHVPPAIDIRWHIAIPMSIFCTSHKASCLYPSICFSYR